MAKLKIKILTNYYKRQTWKNEIIDLKIYMTI